MRAEAGANHSSEVERTREERPEETRSGSGVSWGLWGEGGDAEIAEGGSYRWYQS